MYKLALYVAFVSFLLICANFVSAQTYTFQANQSQYNNTWNFPSDWTVSPGGTHTVPANSATSSIIIASSSGATQGVDISGGNNVTSGSITVNGGASVDVESTLTVGSSTQTQNVTYSSGGALTVTGGGTVTIWGNLYVTGSFTLNVSGSSQLIVKGDVIISSGASLTLAGTGVVTVSGKLSGGNNSSIDVSGGGSKLNVTSTITLGTNSTIKVSGSGNISASSVSVGTGSCETADNSGSKITTSSGTCQNNGSTCTCANVTLPITLTGFFSSLETTSINLKWSTASELNFDYFSLQKSADGKSFNEIAQVKGHGTTGEKHDYSFEDNFPLIGKNYYRLTSVDFDNYQETFKVIVQDYSGGKDFQVSPNPSNGRTISLNFNFDSTQGQVVIYDSMGAIVDSFQVSDSGEVSFTNTLKEGIYFAKFSSPSFAKAIRFLVKQ